MMNRPVTQSRFIYRVGIELEGAWKRERGIRPYSDGSVCGLTGMPSNREQDEDEEPLSMHYSDCDSDDCDGCRMSQQEYDRLMNSRTSLIGEICSDPLPPAEALDWVRRNYPDQSNQTCGLHIHVSLRSAMRYAQLMDDEFRVYYREQMGAWAKANIKSTEFWKRWKGDNHYCADVWMPDEQAQQRGKGSARYAFMNYCYSIIDRHTERARKTVECRVFPVFKEPEIAVATLRKHLSIIHSYLAAQPREVVSARASVSTPTDEVEEVIQCA